MRIREEQIAVFEAIAARKFEDEMVAHLQQFAPRLSQVVGEPSVRQTVRRGVKVSGTYGFTNRGPVRFYLESMMSFGSDFDTDPQLPWAAETLNAPHFTDQMARADGLFAKMHEYYEKVMGPDNEYGVEALRRILNARPRDLIGTDGSFPDRVLFGLEKMYPQKFWHVGEAQLRVLVARGIKSAASHSISNEAGTAPLIGLMFGFGHGVAADSLYPWVGSTLKDTHVADPNDRANRLHEKALSYVRKVLEYLEKA